MNIESQIKAATYAHSNLNAYYAIIALCESGLFYGANNKALDKIVAICKAESAKELGRHDLAVTRALEG